MSSFIHSFIPPAFHLFFCLAWVYDRRFPVSLVDIVNFRSVVIICGKAEKALAEQAFGGEYSRGLMDTGNRVSRKADFIPPISRVLENGWTLPAEFLQETEEEKLEVSRFLWM